MNAMSVPASRKSSSRTRRGRSHEALKPINLATCAACKAVVKPHHACAKCGAYAGRSVK
ncbi:TPA: 50S ribosomal protein L32 [Candidatus Uhrbacteria bacterium]|nr:50S ribosomal protein L32 [Candidatus Uhrbacteria bacterium]